MKFFVLLVLSLAICNLFAAQETGETSSLGAYQPIQWDPSNQELVDVMNWGLENAMLDASAAGELHDAEWHMSEVKSVESEVVNGINYEFVVDIQNVNGEIVEFEFVVNYVEAENQCSLVSWQLRD